MHVCDVREKNIIYGSRPFSFLQLQERDYGTLGIQWKILERSSFEPPSKRYLNFKNTPRSICQTQTYKVIRTVNSHKAKSSEYHTTSS